jgi:hypothetical protein
MFITILCYNANLVYLQVWKYNPLP